jgi:hypothetical protein
MATRRKIERRVAMVGGAYSQKVFAYSRVTFMCRASLPDKTELEGVESSFSGEDAPREIGGRGKECNENCYLDSGH